MNGDKAGNSASFKVLAANGMTRTLGGDHHYVNIFGRDDLAEVDVETMCEHKHVAAFQMIPDFVCINVRGSFVGNEHHDQIAGFCGCGGIHNGKTGFFSLFSAGRIGAKPYYYVYAAFLQIKGVSMALAAVTDNGDGLVFEK